MILFYIFFESRLIPVFIFIMGWGFQVERIQAGIYIILYTLFGSIPLFIIINYLYICEDTLIIDLVSMRGTGFIVYISLILAFLIKMPIYLIHL